MMRRIVASSLKFRRLVVAVAAGMIVFGVVQLSHQPVDRLPEFGSTIVEVRTEALGLSAVEVEQLITVPLEQDLLNGVPFVQDIHSESLPGLSSVVMIFEPGTQLLDARQVVQEKVAEAAVALPGVSAPPQMLQPYSSTSRVLAVRLSSDRLTPIEMSVLARWNIAPRLLGVPGVANVSIWGFRDRQVQVLVDPEELRDADLTLQQIVNSTGNSLWVSPLTFLEASTPGTAGFIDTPNQRFGIRHELPIKDANDLAQVPIEDDAGAAVIVDGEPVRLGDVATLVEDHQPLIGDTVFPDGRPGLMLVVEKLPDSNTVEVTEGVEEALEALRPGLSGMEIDTSLFRPADDVESSARNAVLALAIGGALALAALALLLFEWRSIVIAAAAIVSSLAAAAAVAAIRDITLNVMIVAGLVIALGIVIDDAVTGVRAIADRLRSRGDDGGLPAWRVVLDASVAVRGSLLYATLIAGAAVLPGFFLDGQEGAFLPSVLISYVLLLGISLAVALVVTPALALMLLPGASEGSGSPVLRGLRARHAAAVTGAVHRPRWAYAGMGVALLVGLLMLPFLETSHAVRLRGTDLLVRWDAPPGTSLPAMNAVTAEAVERLNDVPGVDGVSAHVGRAIHSDQVVNVNSGEIWVGLDGSTTVEATTDRIEAILADYPDLSHRVTTYEEQRIDDVLGGRDRDVVVRVYGADHGILDEKAREVHSALTGIQGISGARIETAPTEPTIEVEVDLQRAQRFGVKPGDVRRASAILLSGLAVGNLFEEQKVFDVVVWGAPEIRRSVDDVEQLLIDTPTGDHVRLGDVADVRVVENPTVLRHEAVSNYVDVSADISGRSADDVVADVRTAVEAIDFPLEHHAEVRGSTIAAEGSGGTLLAVAITAALAIFLLLQAAFTSWRLAILALATLPFAAVGGIVAAAIGGGEIGLGAIAGLLAVVGLAARGGVLLIRGYQALERDGGEAFGDELVLRGTSDALVPTLTTSVATILALLPVVIAGDVAGLEIARPAAIVIVGGLVTSTLVTLFVLPALYRMHGFVSLRDGVADDLVVLPEAQVEVEPVTGS
ncbi:MAG TPA: efflux RND transporter permease subunit [Actinomycetota bacterium]|nr:efflux RND transporter permease subunit [Actinomycetota bacterium]